MQNLNEPMQKIKILLSFCTLSLIFNFANCCFPIEQYFMEILNNIYFVITIINTV